MHTPLVSICICLRAEPVHFQHVFSTHNFPVEDHTQLDHIHISSNHLGRDLNVFRNTAMELHFACDKLLRIIVYLFYPALIL